MSVDARQLKGGIVDIFIPTPPRSSQICDFCGQLRPTRIYRTTTGPNTEIGSIPVTPHYKLTHMDADGLWASCEECGSLIDKDDMEGLVKRSVDGILKKNKMHPRNRSWAIETCRSVQTGFWIGKVSGYQRIEE